MIPWLKDQWRLYQDRNLPMAEVLEGASSIQQCCPHCGAVQIRENDSLAVGLIIAGVGVTGAKIKRLFCEKCNQPFRGVGT